MFPGSINYFVTPTYDFNHNYPIELVGVSGESIRSVLELKSNEDARVNSRLHLTYYRYLRSTNGWIASNFKLREQSPLWITSLRGTPWDDTWYLDFVEGLHHMRKRLKKHRDFSRIYKVDRHLN